MKSFVSLGRIVKFDNERTSNLAKSLDKPLDKIHVLFGETTQEEIAKHYVEVLNTLNYIVDKHHNLEFSTKLHYLELNEAVITMG